MSDNIATTNEGHRTRLKNRYDVGGLDGFSDHEVLELLLFYAMPRKDTKAVAKLLLASFGSIEAVFAAKRENILEIPGIGEQTARFLHVIRDVSGHILRKKIFETGIVISNASDLINYLGAAMANLSEEQFKVIFVDNANKVLKEETLSYGTEDQTSVYPRQVMKKALAYHATGILVVHNHPTGRITPSNADKEITKALKGAAAALEIRFLDHLILGREGKGYFSFRENNIL